VRAWVRSVQMSQSEDEMFDCLRARLSAFNSPSSQASTGQASTSGHNYVPDPDMDIDLVEEKEARYIFLIIIINSFVFF